MTNEEAKAMLPDRDQVGVYRDSENGLAEHPSHAWWSKADCEAAIDRFGATLTARVAGHPLTVRDAVGLLYIETRGG